MITIHCFRCQTQMQFASVPPRSEECPKCKSDVRCCRNCGFWDPKVYNECRENQADPVREKDRSNFCGFFQPRSGAGTSSSASSADVLKKAAEALFKKS